MDITSLISLISGLQGSKDSQSNSIMNFFAQSTQNSHTPNETSTQNTAEHQNLNISQILPLLTALGGKSGLDVSSIFPLLSSLNLPNGFNGISNLSGMQNFAPFMQNLAKNSPKTETQENKIIYLHNDGKKISDYKKI